MVPGNRLKRNPLVQLQLQVSQICRPNSLSSILSWPASPASHPGTHRETSYPAGAAGALTFTERWWRRRDHRDFAAKRRHNGGLELCKLLVYISTNVSVSFKLLALFESNFLSKKMTQQHGLALLLCVGAARWCLGRNMTSPSHSEATRGPWLSPRSFSWIQASCVESHLDSCMLSTNHTSRRANM